MKIEELFESFDEPVDPDMEGPIGDAIDRVEAKIDHMHYQFLEVYKKAEQLLEPYLWGNLLYKAPKGTATYTGVISPINGKHYKWHEMPLEVKERFAALEKKYKGLNKAYERLQDKSIRLIKIKRKKDQEDEMRLMHGPE